MNEKENFAFAQKYSISLENAIELYKLQPFITYGDESVTLTLDVTDFELLESIVRELAKSTYIIKTFYITAPLSLQEYLTWFIKVMYYQESEGEDTADVAEVFDNKFTQYPLELKTVRNKIEVIYT